MHLSAQITIASTKTTTSAAKKYRQRLQRGCNIHFVMFENSISPYPPVGLGKLSCDLESRIITCRLSWVGCRKGATERVHSVDSVVYFHNKNTRLNCQPLKPTHSRGSSLSGSKVSLKRLTRATVKIGWLDWIKVEIFRHVPP